MAAYQGRKYRKLYSYLCGLRTGEWRATFSDIEAIVGDKLKPSARRHRASWANDNTQSFARAWLAAGWKTADVNMSAETLTFRREDICAPEGHSISTVNTLHALDELQTALAYRGVDLDEWARSLRAERRAAGL